jgi:hypothetical protein
VRWQASRVDVAEATQVQHRTALNRALPIIGTVRIDAITPQQVADLVAALHTAGKARESIRKTVTALAMVLDHAGISPNPARDRHTHAQPDRRDEPQSHCPDLLAQPRGLRRVSSRTARWTWKVGARTKPGRHRILVTCGSAGRLLTTFATTR